MADGQPTSVVDIAWSVRNNVTSAIDVLDEAGAMLRLNPPEDGERVVDVPEIERVVARMARIPDTLPDPSAFEFKHETFEGLDEGAAPVAADDAPVVEQRKPFVRPDRKVGRNDPCPCGSGKKYKRCCGRRRLVQAAWLREAIARPGV